MEKAESLAGKQEIDARGGRGPRVVVSYGLQGEKPVGGIDAVKLQITVPIGPADTRNGAPSIDVRLTEGQLDRIIESAQVAKARYLELKAASS